MLNLMRTAQRRLIAFKEFLFNGMGIVLNDLCIIINEIQSKINKLLEDKFLAKPVTHHLSRPLN